MKAMDTMEIAVPIPEAAKILGDALHAQVVSGYPHSRPGVLRFFDPMADWGGEGLRVLVSLPDLHEGAVRWMTLPLINPDTGRALGLAPLGASVSGRGAVKAGPDGFLGVYLGDGRAQPDALIGPPSAENLAPLAAAFAAWGGKRGPVPPWVKRAGHAAESAYGGAFKDEKAKAKGWRG